MLGELFTLIIVYHKLDLNFSIVSAAISCAFGDYGVFLMAITAYVADISTHRSRIGVLNLIYNIYWLCVNCHHGVVFGLMRLIVTLDQWHGDYMYVFCLVGILMLLFLVPESFPMEQQSTSSNARGFKALWIGFSLYLKPKLNLWICAIYNN